MRIFCVVLTSCGVSSAVAEDLGGLVVAATPGVGAIDEGVKVEVDRADLRDELADLLEGPDVERPEHKGDQEGVRGGKG